MSLIDTIKSWFRGAAKSVEEVAEGGEPATGGDRETSTNEQLEGAVGEPYSDTR
jgi:hypothetical protein